MDQQPPRFPMEEAPQTSLCTLDLLPPEERQQVRVEWNATAAPQPQECVHALFEAQAARTPDAPAVLFEDAVIRYGELNARANRLARFLQKHGVGPETLVAICVDRSIEMIVGLLGILKAGGAFVPLEPAYPPERIAFILEDSQARLMLTQKTLLDSLPATNTRTICLDSDWNDIALESEENLAAELTAENAAYVIYTSGSTGKPKGVLGVHSASMNRFAWMWREYPFAAGEVCCQKTSLSFVDSVWEIFGPLLQGVQLVLLPDEVVRDPVGLIGALSTNRVTRLVLVPSLLRVILERGDELSERLCDLRYCICSGETLPVELASEFLRRLPGVTLINLYGSTEVTADVTCYEVENTTGLRSIPIGRPLANIRVYILDAYLQPAPVGVPGEILIGGEGLARGYFRRPELTGERFIPDSFNTQAGTRLFRTGDVGRYLPHGDIEYLGRLDHLVKLRGFRIDLGEIEATLTVHPQVNQAVVVALDERGDKRLVAYVVAGIDPPTTTALRAHLREKLPEYMVPAAFVMLESLPLTPSGKLDRAALPAPEKTRAGKLPDAAALPPDKLELGLIQVWEELLGVSPIGVRDNFFVDLGGHSILAVRLLALIEKRLGRRVSLAKLLQGPTIAQLASAIRLDGAVNSGTPLVAINPRGSRPPFFCVAATGSALCYVHLARHLGGDQPFYGLQAPGLDGEQMPLDSIEEFAGCYINALQEVQPDGPYFLGGHSFGGIVAFEMAQQMKRAGHEVAMLAIMDARAPATQAPSSTDLNAEEEDDAERLCKIASVIERFLKKSLAIEYQGLKQLALDEQLAFVLERLKEIDLFPQDAGINHVRGLLRVEKANMRALKRYAAQKYSGRITLFRTAKEDRKGLSLQGHSTPALGWQALSPEPVEIHTVPGDHITMITKANVSMLARQLRKHLESLDFQLRA